MPQVGDAEPPLVPQVSPGPQGAWMASWTTSSSQSSPQASG